MLGAFAEFARTLIRERVVAGRVAARARGHKGGRRPKLSPAHQRQAQLLKQGGVVSANLLHGCDQWHVQNPWTENLRSAWSGDKASVMLGSLAYAND